MDSPDHLVIERCSAALSTVAIHKLSPGQIIALTQSFGCTWPTIPNSVGAACTILWMSPQQWLVDGMAHDDVIVRVAHGCADALYDVSDQSSAYAVFEISGGHSRAILSKSCSLDFHERVFLPETCAQSVFAQVPVLVYRPSNESSFRLYVESSVARYVHDWLEDAASEYSTVRIRR